MQMAATAAIECTIRAEPDNKFLRLAAIARSATAASGRYDFLIIKRSETGSSKNVQSGTFILQGCREQVLTTVALDRSAIGNYRAELALQSDHERFTCTSP